MSPLFDLPHINPDFSIEKELCTKGYRTIAGVDEAGRGALAGPLSLGMVIYPLSIYTDTPEPILNTIADSKKLSLRKREEAFLIIKNFSQHYTSVFVPHTVIDRTDINIATKTGIERLIAKSQIKPDIIIMDGNFKFEFDIKFMSVIKGDNKSISIASASIVAKVLRDELMNKADLKYPDYGFKIHKGYGTKKHIESLYNNGFSNIHRKSYEPVKSLIKQEEIKKRD
ncbi:MAG: ribonuclease HII [Spirochaetes bacterium]|nr:ribonuclease HII [Spirochaetota bacterium]